MAIKPETEFPGKIIAGNANYPHGEARNVVIQDDGTGTPLLARYVNDIWGFLQRLLLDAGVTPSGNPDTVLASDYVDSLNAIYSRLAQPNVFTQNQIIEKALPELILKDTARVAQVRVVEQAGRAFLAYNAFFDGTNWQRDDTTATSWLMGAGGNTFQTYYSAAGTGPITFTNVVHFDNTGKMIVGAVPLARMATIRLDSSSALGPGLVLNINIQGASNTHRFYSRSIRGAGPANWYEGVSIAATGLVAADRHSALVRSSNGVNDLLNIVNGSTTTETAAYKVYEIPET